MEPGRRKRVGDDHRVDTTLRLRHRDCNSGDVGSTVRTSYTINKPPFKRRRADNVDVPEDIEKTLKRAIEIFENDEEPLEGESVAYLLEDLDRVLNAFTVKRPPYLIDIYNSNEEPIVFYYRTCRKVGIGTCNH